MGHFLNGGSVGSDIVVCMGLDGKCDRPFVTVETKHSVGRLLDACQKLPSPFVEGVLHDYIYLEVHGDRL